VLRSSFIKRKKEKMHSKGEFKKKIMGQNGSKNPKKKIKIGGERKALVGKRKRGSQERI